MTFWNEERVNKASSLWKSGATVDELAEYFCVGRGSISGVMYRTRQTNSGLFPARDSYRGLIAVISSKNTKSLSKTVLQPKKKTQQFLPAKDLNMRVSIIGDGGYVHMDGKTITTNAKYARRVARKYAEKMILKAGDPSLKIISAVTA